MDVVHRDVGGIRAGLAYLHERTGLYESARRHLKGLIDCGLPDLQNGESAGFGHPFSLQVEFVRHSDGMFELELRFGDGNTGTRSVQRIRSAGLDSGEYEIQKISIGEWMAEHKRGREK